MCSKRWQPIGNRNFESGAAENTEQAGIAGLGKVADNPGGIDKHVSNHLYRRLTSTGFLTEGLSG